MPCFFVCFDEVDGARERAVVGEPDGGHLELRRAGRESGNAARPIEDRELGVDVQVDEIGRSGHGQATLQGAPEDLFGLSRRAF